MVINIIGDCDKRPVLYTVMKICQSLGDVLLVTSSSRLIRLSDTGESYGHCQNTMIAVTHDGIDDFWEAFTYDVTDFEFVIIDNIVSAEADLVIYVKGMAQSQNESDNLEYIDEYETIDLYQGKYINSSTLLRCEEFEALKDFCPINQKIASSVATIMAKALNTDAKKIESLAMVQTSTHPTDLPKPKSKFFGRG